MQSKTTRVGNQNKPKGFDLGGKGGNAWGVVNVGAVMDALEYVAPDNAERMSVASALSGISKDKYLAETKFHYTHDSGVTRAIIKPAKDDCQGEKDVKTLTMLLWAAQTPILLEATRAGSDVLSRCLKQLVLGIFEPKFFVRPIKKKQ